MHAARGSTAAIEGSLERHSTPGPMIPSSNVTLKWCVAMTPRGDRELVVFGESPEDRQDF